MDLTLARALLDNSLAFTERHRGPVRREGTLVHLESLEADFRCTVVEALPDEPLPPAIHTLRTVPWAGEVAGRLRAQGFVRRGTLRYLQLTRERRAEASPLSIRVAADTRELMAFSEVQARGFLLPNESFGHWFGLLHEANLRNFQDPAQRFWLGRLQWRAVTVGHVLSTGEVAGLYAVATLPGFRRRGFSRALLAEAIYAARKEGARVVTLQVYGQTPAEALYLALGFSPVFDMEVWTRG